MFVDEPLMNFDNFPQRWLNRFDLKYFASNFRDNLLPNIWCFWKNNLNPTIILRDDHHVAFIVKVSNISLGLSVIYASTSYLQRRQL